jgi:hypothetical protein
MKSLNETHDGEYTERRNDACRVYDLAESFAINSEYENDCCEEPHHAPLLLTLHASLKPLLGNVNFEVIS